MDGNQLNLNGLDIDPNIIRRAWEGDLHAQLEVGSAYFVSVYVEDNLSNASEWISRSAAQGNMEAQFWLGNLYALGQGVKQSYMDAYQWYTKSAIQGYTKALVRIHNLYQQDKKIHSRGKLNAEEDLKKLPRFLGEEEKYYYRELYEQRLDEQEQKLSNTINYFSQSFQDYKSLDQGDPVVQVNLAFHYQHGYGTVKYEPWAIEYYTKASTQGHRDAQYNLGYIYQQNTNLKFHCRLALRWLRTSATNGNIAAQNSLAYYYEKGLATDIDYELAKYWYTKAAVAGNSDAQLTLGKWYRKGEHVQKDLSEAVKWYELAARQGNIAAQNVLNQLNEKETYNHVSNISTTHTLTSRLQDDLNKLASIGNFQELQKLCHHARRADGNAMYQIGLKYYNGEDFSEDKDTGFQWIKNAAKAGIQIAEKKIAQMYEEGDATDQDYHESVKWVKKSANKKNSEAQCKLGSLFKNGIGVRRDLLEASKWFIFSADQNNSDALYQLGLLRLNGEGLHKDIWEAFNLISRSVRSKNVLGIFKLGQLYENGIDGVLEPDIDRAIRLYEAAARLGNSTAQNKLGQLYEEGSVVQSDLGKAEEYYKMAANSGNATYQVNLAKKYLDWTFLDEDYIKSFQLLKHAAEQKHYDATRLFQTPIPLGDTFFDLTKIIDMFKLVSQKGIYNLEFNIGYAYEHGITGHSKLNPAPVDYMNVEEWYSVAATKGDSRAQFRLGMMYYEGKGVDKNLYKALSFNSQAHENDNSDATYTLAQMYLNSYGVRQDLAKAFHLFNHASSMGHKEASQMLYPSYSRGNLKMLENIASVGNVAIQHRLGIFYQEDNETIAFKYFVSAAQGGLIDAHYWLGVFLQEGRGTVRNYKQAIKSYENAAAKDHEEAIYRLAQMYLHGKGTKVDYENAYRLFTMAAKQGHYLSRKFLNITNQPFSALYDKIEQGSPGVGSNSKNMDYSFPSTSDEFGYSMEMYKHIAEKGDTGVQYMLGLVFEDILSLPNYPEAFKWFTMSAGNSHPRAIYRLGLLYEKGLRVSQNYHEAAQLYEVSSDSTDPESSGRTDEYTQLYVGSNNFFLENQKETVLLGDKSLSKYVGSATEQGENLTFDYQKRLDHHLRAASKGDQDPTSEYRKALDYYLRAASNGDETAQYYLGFMYQREYIPEIDKQQAVVWLTEAAEKGHIDAQFSLAMLYFTGRDSGVDYRSTLKFLKKAALSGHRKAIFHIGWMYKHGLGFNKSEEEAAKWFSISLSSMQTQSSYDFDISHLVRKIENLVVENMNNPASETNLETLSYNGDGDASYKLSQKFLNGKDFEVDHTKGVSYLRVGASQGHQLCKEEFAFLYYYGKFVRKDLRLAFLWFKRGEKLGSNKLKFHLAQIYHCGVIGDSDFTSALKLYKAIDGEYLSLVLQQKGLLYENGNVLKKDYSMAYHCYAKSFNDGNFISGYNVALLYFYGKGVTRDYIEAIYWLEKSLDKSTLTHLHYILLETEFSQATTSAGTPRKTYSLVTYDAFVGEILYLLGKIYSDGLGVPRNGEKARSYFKQAAEKGNEKAKNYLNENPQ